MPLDFSLLSSTSTQPQQMAGGFPLLPPPPSSVTPSSQFSPFASFPAQPGNLSVTTPTSVPQQMSPGSALQGFGLDVFGSGGASPGNQQGSPLLGGKPGTGMQGGMGMGLQQPNMGMGLQQPNMGMGSQQPVMGMGLQQPVMGMGFQQPAVAPLVNADPLAVLNDLHVSLDSIQPGG